MEQVEGLRGKEALVQAVVKNIARREDKPPETRSDEELRALLRAKGEETMQVRSGPLLCKRQRREKAYRNICCSFAM